MLKTAKRGGAVGACVILLSCFGCGDKGPVLEPQPQPDDGTAVLTVIGTNPQPDTIEAATSISARVTKADGSPRAGTTVVFSVYADSGSLTSSMRIGAAQDTVWTNSIATTTNEQGEASARILYAEKPGVAHIRVVSVPYQLTQSVAYTTLAGAPNKVTVVPADTLVVPGGAVTYSATVVDRFNTVLPDTAVFSTDGVLASITRQGAAIGVASGLPAIQATVTRNGRTTVGTTALFVVPPTPIAWANGDIYVGSLANTTTQRISIGYAGSVAWKPGSDLLAYNTLSTLETTTISGNRSQLPIASATGAEWPEYSPDGQWLYFSAMIDNVRRIVREHPDGSAFEILTKNDTASAASVSPDGLRIAFASNSRLKIMDLSSGAVTVIATKSTPFPNGDANLYAPRWSPDGARIAYSNGGDNKLMVLNLNTGVTAEFGITERSSPGFSWSPDSQWLVTFNGSVAPSVGKLIHVATGKSRSIPWIKFTPAWKR